MPGYTADPPGSRRPISLACDASDAHLGAVLQQLSPKGWQPLSFYSKKLDDPQKCYSTFDRELLAAYLAVRHVRFLLEGREYFIETDHKPLTYALHRVSEPWSACQQCQLGYLAEFTADIRHVTGKQNVVADGLSRPLASDSSTSCGPGSAACKTGNVKAPRVFDSNRRRRLNTCQLGVKRAQLGGTSVWHCKSALQVFASRRRRLPLQSHTADRGKYLRLGRPLNMRLIARDQKLCEQVQVTLASSSLQVHPLQFGDSTILCDVTDGKARPVVPKSHASPSSSVRRQHHLV